MKGARLIAVLVVGLVARERSLLTSPSSLNFALTMT